MTDVGLKELAGLKNLQRLNLGDTAVGDVGLKELAGLKSLQTLDLRFTKVTNAGLKVLAGLKNLQRLSLGGTKVTDAGVAALGATFGSLGGKFRARAAAVATNAVLARIDSVALRMNPMSPLP